MQKFNVVSADENIAIVRASSLVAVVCRGEFNISAATKCHQATLKLVEEYPNEGAVLVVVEANGPMPTSEARSKTAETMAEVAKKIAGWAVVIEGGGLRPTIVRSALVTINMMSRTGMPTRYFEHVRDASSWLGDQSRPLRALEIQQAVEYARSQIRSRTGGAVG